jgi:hypothetical protein
MDTYNMNTAYHLLTPNYRSRLGDNEAYGRTLASVLGPDVIQQRAAERKYTPPKLSLAHLGDMLDKAAAAIVAIIKEHLAPVPNVRNYDEQRDLRSFQVGETYSRELDLFEAGHFDATERVLAGEILHRASLKSTWPEPASTSGLAMIDIFLKDFIAAIKPLLAKQADLGLEAVAY